MEKNSQEYFDSIKKQVNDKKKLAIIISIVGAIIVFCALLYITFWAGLPIGASSWSTTVVSIVVILFVAFSASAYYFSYQHLFRWFVDEIQTNHYKEKEYVELVERAYMEIK